MNRNHSLYIFHIDYKDVFSKDFEQTFTYQEKEILEITSMNCVVDNKMGDKGINNIVDYKIDHIANYRWLLPGLFAKTIILKFL